MTTLAALIVLSALVMVLAAVIVTPLLLALALAAAVLKLTFFLLFLPFRLIGWAFGH